MCIVIDTDTFARVFIASNAEHREFKPVLDWIIDGPGIIVWGGNTYLNQLKAAGRFLALFTELQKVGKVHVADSGQVDSQERKVRITLPDPDFDDQHIVAILLVTGCLLVCTADKRSHKFVAHQAFFPRVQQRPRFYGGRKDAKKLCTRNIPDRFKPSPRLGKAQKQQLAAWHLA